MINLRTIQQKPWRLIPIILLMMLLWGLYQGMQVDQLIENVEQKDLPIPHFNLMDIRHDTVVTQENLKDNIHIIHVWASWCGVCIKEHQEWIKIKNQLSYPLVGIAYRDQKEPVLSILHNAGDPYSYLLDDVHGSLGLGMGIIGTPMSFIVDKKGIIRFRHLGPLSQRAFNTIFVPILEKIENEEA